MKQMQMVLVVLLVVLIVFGWGSAILNSFGGDNDLYQSHIEQAEDYMARGLYQKAAISYLDAVAIKDTAEVRMAALDAYAKRFEESDAIYDDYLLAAEDAVIMHSDNAEFVLRAADLYLVQENYSSAYKSLKNALDMGMEDERVQNMFRQVRYSCGEQWAEYRGYTACVNGYYTVREMDTWDYMGADGADADLGKFIFAGPVGETGMRVLGTEERYWLEDEDGIVQGILQFVPEAAGVYSEGLIPVMHNGTYAYYNSLGDKQFGAYAEAGAFYNGTAAVKENSAWHIIDTQGNKVSESTYEQIVLNPDGSYLKNGVMLAQNGGKYQLYDAEGELVSDFSCTNVDIVTNDGLVAFEQNGKWGFVDLEGNIVIQPAYQLARSFSNGLAAVYDGALWGFIDTEGHLVLDYQYINVDYFNEEGGCMVLYEIAEEVVYSDEAQEELVFEFDTAEESEEGTEETEIVEEIDLETAMAMEAENQETIEVELWMLIVRHINK